MSFYDLEWKTEQAFLAKLNAAAITGLNLYAGHDDSEITLPSCSVHARQGEEFPVESANYKMAVEVQVNSSADVASAETVHKGLVASVRDALLVSTIAADLSAAVADFTVPNIWQKGIETTVDDRHFQSGLTLELIAANADL